MDYRVVVAKESFYKSKVAQYLANKYGLSMADLFDLCSDHEEGNLLSVGEIEDSGILVAATKDVPVVSYSSWLAFINPKEYEKMYNKQKTQEEIALQSLDKKRKQYQRTDDETVVVNVNRSHHMPTSSIHIIVNFNENEGEEGDDYVR